jgi:hypothetical protein
MVDVRGRFLKLRNTLRGHLPRLAHRGSQTITTTDPTQERRGYVADAWADALVTLAAVTAAIAVSVLDYVSHPQGFWLELTLKAAEIGTAVLVIDHVAKMVWYRTFIGSFLRWPWRRLRRSRGGTGGPGGAVARQAGRTDHGGQAGQEPPGGPPPSATALAVPRYRPSIPRFIETYMESWAVPVVDPSHAAGSRLAYPEPGFAIVRILGSILLSILGGLVGAVFALVSGSLAVTTQNPGFGSIVNISLVLLSLLTLSLAFRVRRPSYARRRRRWPTFLTILLLLLIGVGASAAVLMR